MEPIIRLDGFNGTKAIWKSRTLGKAKVCTAAFFPSAAREFKFA
jgi:hypothetical protein